ncbi:MAG: hypothetical protein CVU47_08715 [Chloroflexi bacterium HGW-Chloroflexi-9]|nr:MAG: hypothetical protein CVU47_08715 [Chloroflexi bacterium HGW-Chloroflexi-9]
MTTNARPAKERRLLVNLSVVAGSAAMLAASWLGIASPGPAEDDGTTFAAVPAAPVAPVTPAVSPAVASADAVGAANLIPTPAPVPRRVIVTRQSRAS